MSAKAKPKRVRVNPEDLKTLDAKLKTGSKTVRSVGGGPEAKAIDNGKIPRRRNPAKKTKQSTKSANELMLEAWKYIWENRHRRLTKP